MGGPCFRVESWNGNGSYIITRGNHTGIFGVDASNCDPSGSPCGWSYGIAGGAFNTGGYCGYDPSNGCGLLEANSYSDDEFGNCIEHVIYLGFCGILLNLSIIETLTQQIWTYAISIPWGPQVWQGTRALPIASKVCNPSAFRINADFTTASASPLYGGYVEITA